MHITIDALLIVGLILNFVKAGDLVLRPHQLKWFQDRFEHLTLWLDFTKPLKALKSLTSDDGRLALLVLGYVPAIFLLAAARAVQTSEPKGISLITYLNFGILTRVIISQEIPGIKHRTVSRSGPARFVISFDEVSLRSFNRNFLAQRPVRGRHIGPSRSGFVEPCVFNDLVSLLLNYPGQFDSLDL